MKSSSEPEHVSEELEEEEYDADLQYEREQAVLEQLLKMEEEFRDLYAFHLKETEQQRIIVDRLWLLTQRYIIIRFPTCHKSSEHHPFPAENAILQEYNEKLKSLRSSNCQIFLGLQKIRLSVRKFEQLCSLLDMHAETPFMIGDHFHKPISYFIELINDLFSYLNALLLKMKYHVDLLDPEDRTILDEYKNVLQPSEDFTEYLEMGLSYCKCLRPKPQCVTRENPKRICKKK